MSNITLAEASAVVDGALQHGRAKKFKPLTVAVLDGGGHLVAFKREDDSSLLRFDIATGKAWGCLGMGFGGRGFAKRVQNAPHFVNALTVISGGRLVPQPGGVLIRREGKIVGAVGISGDTADNDEACAVAGVQVAGLLADIGENA